MALLKFKAFKKMLSEVKAEKLKEKASKEYKSIYTERLKSYGVSDASELTDEQLSEFLENLKTYKNKKHI